MADHFVPTSKCSFWKQASSWQSVRIAEISSEIHQLRSLPSTFSRWKSVEFPTNVIHNAQTSRGTGNRRRLIWIRWKCGVFVGQITPRALIGAGSSISRGRAVIKRSLGPRTVGGVARARTSGRRRRGPHPALFSGPFCSKVHMVEVMHYGRSHMTGSFAYVAPAPPLKATWKQPAQWGDSYGIPPRGAHALLFFYHLLGEY